MAFSRTMLSPTAAYMAPALLILAAGTALVSVSNFSNAQSQPGTPSQTQPDSRNQRDQNQRDQNQRDQNQRDQNQRDQNQRDGTTTPGNVQPGTPNDTRRDPRNVDRSNMQPEDEDFFWRDDLMREDGQRREGYVSPFTFMSPQSRAGFDTRTQRLVRMEDRLTERTDELIRRLGEVRQMPAERRDEAMMDLMQQILLDHRRLMLYLKQSRTAWSGDVSGMTATGEERTMPGMNPGANPPTTPGNTPGSPGNPGRDPRSPR